MNENKETVAKEVVIPITIRTSYVESNEFDDARLQIDLTSHHLSSLMWFIKTASEGHDLLDIKTDMKLYDFAEYRNNVGLMCDLGIALSDRLSLLSTMTVNDTVNEKPTELASDAIKANRQNDPPENNEGLEHLANQLAAVMKNPSIPKALFNAMSDELTAMPADWRTPENILFSLQELNRKEGKDS